jgi:WD40 repeat protein/DNA-binding SARP family transcriptional activator
LSDQEFRVTLLSIALLGGFRVERNGEPVTGFESNKVRALLAYLAIEADRAHQRSVLAGLLWPDHAEETARTNLRHVLRQLRKTLPDADGAAPLLLTSQQTVQLNPDSRTTLDVARFDALLRECDRCDHRALEACAACIERYREAASLYGGPLLNGFDLPDSDLFDEWAAVKREQLHREALEICYTLAATYQDAGAYEPARKYAYRQLELEPWREEAHRQLMRVLARSGQRTAALVQYAQCRKVLADELGVEPDPETTALYEAIRTGKLASPAARPPGTLPARPVQAAAAERGDEQPAELYDWGEAPASAYFYGRQAEQATLEQWLVGERRSVVLVLSMGGMGKTSLVARVARALAPRFACVFWRSLLNAPPLSGLLQECVQSLSRQQLTYLPTGLNEQLNLLHTYLSKHRCLLVLDNLESILEAGPAGHYRNGYEDYGRLLERMARGGHQSCLVLTSRERPRGFERLADDTGQVRTLELRGLELGAGEALLKTRGIADETELLASVVRLYSGNPLALKLVARTIQELFDGDIAAFLGGELPIFDDIRTVLDEQFARLTPLEQEILVWLAIEREAIGVPALEQRLVRPPGRRNVLEALRALQSRSLLEKTEAGLALQNVVAEYVTDSLVERVSEEIARGALGTLNRYGLLRAQAREYVRQSQVRLVLAPIVTALHATFGLHGVETHVRELLGRLRADSSLPPGYAGGNILNLLLHMGIDPTGYDFSGLAVWQASLRGVRLHDVDLRQADLSGSSFTDTFGIITLVTYSPDGRHLVAGTWNGDVRIWRVPDYQPVRVIRAQSGSIRALVFHPSGEFFASAGDDFLIHLWDAAQGQLLRTLHGHTGFLKALAFSPDGMLLASCATDTTIRIWDVASGQLLRTLEGHTNATFSVAFSPDGRLLASGSADRTVKLWRTADWSDRQTLGGHQDELRSVVFSPDGTLLATGSLDRTLRIWDVEPPAAGDSDGGSEPARLRGILRGHERDVRWVVFSPNGATLASGSADYTIRLWDVQSGQIRRVLHGHRKGVNSLAFTPHGDLLASGGDDLTIRIWNAQSGQAGHTLHGYTRLVRTVAFSPDGTTVASGSDDAVLRLWNAANGALVRRCLGHDHWIWSLAFSPDGACVASGGADHLLCLWDAHDTSGRPRAILRQHGSTVRAMAFSADGTRLVTGSADTKVRIYHPQGAVLLHELEGHLDFVNTIAISPDGSLVASGGSDNAVRLWWLEGGRAHNVLHGHRDIVQWVAFSPDGTTLASCSADSSVVLWDITSGRRLLVLQGHDREVGRVMFSPDGGTLASSSADSSVVLWDIGSGRRLHVLQGHSAGITSIAFSPDGRTLASSSADQTICLWDVTTGQLCHVLHEHRHWVWAIVFSPDGSTLASGSVDETIKLWDVSSGTCQHTLRPRGPYAGTRIAGVRGITAAQTATLLALGAVE